MIALIKISTTRWPLALIGSALAMSTGCLDAQRSSDSESDFICRTDQDCDSANSEVCDNNTCFGNPPMGLFSAIIDPPDERQELSTTEIIGLNIEPNGRIGQLRFDESQVVFGQIFLRCAENDQRCVLGSNVAARITFDKESRIPGGPRIQRSVTTRVSNRGEPHFSVRLPKLLAGEHYNATITPQQATLPQQANVTQITPLTRRIINSETSEVLWYIGGEANYKIVAVQIDYPPLTPPSWEVFAHGRWSPDGELLRISTTATTPTSINTEEGHSTYHIRLPIEAEDTFEIVARSLNIASEPILKQQEILIPDPREITTEVVANVNLVRPVAPNGAYFEVAVVSHTASGEDVAVSGAHIRLTSILPRENGRSTLATHIIEAVTDEHGRAIVMLLPGTTRANRSYTVRIIPPLDSEHEIFFDGEVSVGQSTGEFAVLPIFRLTRRVPITGVITDIHGRPVSGVAVNAEPAAELLATLDQATLNIVSNAVYSSISDENGIYSILVDRKIADHQAIYDLKAVVPTRFGLSQATIMSITLNEQIDNLNPFYLDIMIPEPSYARGYITADGEQIHGAGLRIYEEDASSVRCRNQNNFESATCTKTALLRWVTRSNNLTGEAIIILPRN